jgi:hypothetical protein
MVRVRVRVRVRGEELGEVKISPSSSRDLFTVLL